jgi:hypothetical protein
MARRSRDILIALGIVVLGGAVAIALLLGIRGSNSDSDSAVVAQVNGRSTTTLAVGTCKTERGFLGDTTCNPAPEQVAKAADIPIPASATNFTATFESFQDWNLEARFFVPLDQASVYTSLPNYPGATVDGPSVDGTGGGAGEYRKLTLATVDGMLEVSISVFTT